MNLAPTTNTTTPQYKYNDNLHLKVIEFLRDYYSRADTKSYFVLATLDDEGNFKQKFFKVSKLYDNPQTIVKFIEKNFDKNLYYSVNTFNSKLRSAGNVREILALNFDFDLKRPITNDEVSKILSVIREFEEKTQIKTTIVKSGGGVQVLILTDTPLYYKDFISDSEYKALMEKYGPDLDGAEEEVYRIADKNMKSILSLLGSVFEEKINEAGLNIKVDSSVFDFSRVMRLPYSYNQKYEAPIFVELIQYELNEQYRIISLINELLEKIVDKYTVEVEGNNVTTKLKVDVNDERIKKLIETIKEFDIYKPGVSRSAVTLHLASLLHKRTNISYEEFEKILDAIHEEFKVEDSKRREKYAESKSVFRAEKKRVASAYWLMQVADMLAKEWNVSREEAKKIILEYHRKVKEVFGIDELDKVFSYFKKLEEDSEKIDLIGKTILNEKDIEQLQRVILNAYNVMKSIKIDNFTFEMFTRYVTRILKKYAEINKDILIRIFKDIENFSVAYSIIDEEIKNDNTNFAEIITKYITYSELKKEEITKVRRILRRVLHDIIAVISQQTAQKIKKITIEELRKRTKGVYIYNDVIRINIEGVGEVEFEYKFGVKKVKVDKETWYVSNFEDNFKKLAEVLYKVYGFKIDSATEEEVKSFFDYLEGIGYKINMELYNIDVATVLYELLIQNIEKYEHYLKLTKQEADYFFKIVNSRDMKKYITIPKPLLERMLQYSSLTEKEKKIVLKSSDKADMVRFANKRLYAFYYDVEKFSEIGIDIVEELNKLAEERASDYAELVNEGLLDGLIVVEKVSGGGSE